MTTPEWNEMQAKMGEAVNITDTVVFKAVPLCITNGKWYPPEHEVMECYADRFIIDDKPATDAEAASFVRRMTDAGVVELLRGVVEVIEGGH